MLYSIENEKIKIEVSTIGATLTKFIDKKTNTDIVLGFNDEKDYNPTISPYFGTTVGRNANRIGNCKFELNGETYTLVNNDHGNNLHSNGGCCFKEFELLEKTDSSLLFSIDMKDTEDGFPGNCNLKVKYELVDNKLDLTFEGISDKDTIFNITNHSYFNLDGGINDALNHKVTIYADKVALDDENGMASDKVIDVKGTSFDFTSEKVLKDNLALNHPNLVLGGIDHNYVVENMEFKKLVKLSNDKLKLTISSDLPDVQVYTACSFGKINGKHEYSQYYGIAVEPQFYPNGINYNGLLKPIIKANEITSHRIEYLLED